MGRGIAMELTLDDFMAKEASSNALYRGTKHHFMRDQVSTTPSASLIPKSHLSIKQHHSATTPAYASHPDSSHRLHYRVVCTSWSSLHFRDRDSISYRRGWTRRVGTRSRRRRGPAMMSVLRVLSWRRSTWLTIPVSAVRC